MKIKRWLAMIMVVALVVTLMVQTVSALSIVRENAKIYNESENEITNQTIEMTVGEAMYVIYNGPYEVFRADGTPLYDPTFIGTDEYYENQEYYDQFEYYTLLEDDLGTSNSSHPEVATIEGNCLISAISPGISEITIKFSDTIQDNVSGEVAKTNGSASFTVVVKAVEYHNPFEGIDLSQVENPFSDLSVDDWYYEDVLYLYAAGFFDGVEMMGGDMVEPVQLAAAGNGTVSLHRLGTATAQLQKLASGKYQFNGGSNAGRAWNVSVLYNGHQSAGGTVGSYGLQWFTDVPTTASYFQPVQWAAYTSTVKGYGNDLFGPLDGVTREQFCTILLRYAQRFGLSMPAIVGAKTFSDAGQVSSWAKEAVDACQQAGIIKGMGNNTFAPRAGITTGQAAAMIHRFFENCAGGKTV